MPPSAQVRSERSQARRERWRLLRRRPGFIIGCIVFFFSLRGSTQQWFLIWNGVGLVVYFAWSAWNSRLAKGEEAEG